MKNPSNESLIRVTDYPSEPAHITVWVAAFFSLAAVLCLQATVLDDFNSATRTGWADTPNGGHLTQSGGQLQVTTAASSGALTYGTKTSQSFANAASQSLEFRVDVNAVVPGSGDPNAAAILAWLPSGAVPGSGSSGYSLWVTAGGATLKHGSTSLATASYPAAATNNQNTTLMLRMTPSGGSISVNARVYRQTGSLPMQTNTIVWETTQTVSDSVGTPGDAAVGTSSGASASGATVNFDNLQVFPLQDSVLDDFSGGSADLANYSQTLNGGSAVISGGQLELKTITLNNTVYSAVRRTAPNYQIIDGSRLELGVDIVNNATGPFDPDAFAALSYTPFNSDAGVGYLIGYHIGAGCYGLSIGKAYGEWWVNQQPYPTYLSTGNSIPASNVRLIISMTGEGTSVRIDSRVEDLNVGVNDPARVLYQNVFVDTAAADPMDNNTTPAYGDGGLPGTSAAAYLNAPGSVALYAFYGGTSGDSVDITYDNLVVNQTAPANLPPAIGSISPPDRSNFVATAASQVSFQVTDDINIPANNVGLTLNGVTYANGSGATVTGTTASKTFTLSSPLAPDTFYTGSIQATDSVGAVTIQNYSFDTFRTNTCYVVESEDYNYGSGQYIEPYNTLVNQYQGLAGTAEVDFHDSRTSMDAANSVYRQDPVRNNITGDGPRPKYAGSAPGEIVLVDRQNGDWDNYTHVYPAGWYTAYMRMSQYIVPVSVIELDRVTSDPTQPDQTTVPLGSFLGTATGYDINHDVPLTDAFGNRLLVQFSGAADTLRVNNISVQATDSDLWQNYMVLAPATSPGSQPPFVSQVSPAAGAVVGLNALGTNNATIVNRDSTVDATSVIVQINGVTVPSTATVTAGGATVIWIPAGSSATLTNTLIFKDNLNAWQTNSWAYSYSTVLQAANSLPLGSLTVPGFDARMVQSSSTGDPAYANIGNGGLANSVDSAKAVLAIPPQYTVNLTSTNIVQTVNWGIGGNEYADQNNFPGLCLPPADINSYAVEIFAYLQLTAGVHRFYVDSDDDVGIYSGANLADTSTVLVETTGVVHESLDFLVPADGLYPFHVVYEEGGGAAYLRLQSVSLSDNSQTLLNASGGVNAYYPLVCKSATAVAGPYTVDAAANAANALATANVLCDGTGTALNQTLTGGTITIPIAGSAKFYRLDGPRPSKVTSITKVGSNVVITYQAQ